MMSDTLLCYAQATEDGTLLGLSNHAQPHPRYAGLDAFEAQISIPLTTTQAAVLGELRRCAGQTRYSVRSAAAQLGLDGFDPASTELCVDGSQALVTTLLTDWRSKTNSATLKALRQLTQSGHSPRVVRGVLLPHAARIAAPLTGLRPLPGDPWTATIRLADERYDIDDERVDEPFIREMLSNGSARHHLERVRTRRPGRPKSLAGGEFFLGGIDVPALPYHLVVRQHTTRANGDITAILHGHSCLFDAGRQHRQLELLNTAAAPESLDDFWLLVHPYRAAPESEKMAA